VPGADYVADLVDLDTALASADVVITGEGRFDATSLGGKVVGAVLHRTVASSATVHVVCGQAEEGVRVEGVAVPRVLQLTDLAGSAEAAIGEVQRWLKVAGARLAAAHADRTR
jgi:glycerate kinase